MRNPILVLLSSIDHKTDLGKKFPVIYKWFEPHVFEYYCVFCRTICDCWWEDYWRSDVEREIENEL